MFVVCFTLLVANYYFYIFSKIRQHTKRGVSDASENEFFAGCFQGVVLLYGADYRYLMMQHSL